MAIEQPSPSLPQVLVVDDDADIRRLIELRLSRRGHVVTTAVSGEDALAVIAEHGAPDVAVLDVMLPGMTGLVLASALREQCGAQPLPVVFISARVGIRDVEAGRALGASYLPKPFSGAVLADYVEQAFTSQSAVGAPAAELVVPEPPAVLRLADRELLRNGLPQVVPGALAPLSTGWLPRSSGERASLNATLDPGGELRCWTVLFLTTGREQHDVYAGSVVEDLIEQVNARIDLLGARGFRDAAGERPARFSCEQALGAFGLSPAPDAPVVADAPAAA